MVMLEIMSEDQLNEKLLYIGVAILKHSKYLDDHYIQITTLHQQEKFYRHWVKNHKKLNKLYDKYYDRLEELEIDKQIREEFENARYKSSNI